MPILLRDSVTGEWIEFADDAHCAACGQKHDPREAYSSLVVDHDRWTARPWRTRLLCALCNVKKGNRRYVPFGIRVWLPGMNPGETIPRPGGPISGWACLEASVVVDSASLSCSEGNTQAA